MTKYSGNCTIDVTINDLNSSGKVIYNLIKANSKITRDDIASAIDKNVNQFKELPIHLLQKVTY